MLYHPDNDHWQTWHEAVSRTGINSKRSKAHAILIELEHLTPEQFEFFTANLYRDLN